MSDREVTTPGPLRAGAPQRWQAPASLPSVTANAIVPWLVGSTVEEIERELILQTLAYCGGNRTRSAIILGISIRTLRNKIKDYVARGFAVTGSGRSKLGEPIPRAPMLPEHPQCS